ARRHSTLTLFPYTTLFRSSIYGLIAIGYTMVYGIVGMINFAHGDIFMVGAFVALIVFLILGAMFYSVPVVVALLIMMIVSMILRSEEHTSELQSRENLVCR